MKIVNKEKFFKLPSGTLYSEYEPDNTLTSEVTKE